MNVCEIDGCTDQRRAKGYCWKHYHRVRSHGDPHYRESFRNDPEGAFWHRTVKTDGCWNWTGAKSDRGYGKLNVHGVHTFAHRYSFTLANGPIPDGLVIDHICHNTSCVRPDHLQAVTTKQNTENQSILRSDNTSGCRGVSYDDRHKRWRARVTHHGHEYSAGRFLSRAEAEAAVIGLRNQLFTNNIYDKGNH